jgi:hypothetical protein
MQAERESSEAEERVTKPFMVHPNFRTEELLEEADDRMACVCGLLNLLACGKANGSEGNEEDLEEAARGSLKLLEEARALNAEYSHRIWERARPMREAAERRRKRARLESQLTEFGVKTLGKDRAAARRAAKEAVAATEEKKAAEPAGTNGGAQ